jgi:uncharacterized protein (TIGR02271 family)
MANIGTVNNQSPHASPGANLTATENADPDQGAVVVPVVREELDVEKQTVETGRVRVRKTVHERVQPVDVPLYADEVDVERVRIDRFVEEPPEMRQEGETWIVPLVEEVLVKRLVLREELRIRRTRRELPQPEPQTLRYEQAHVQRMPERTTPAASGPADSDAPSQTQPEKEL